MCILMFKDHSFKLLFPIFINCFSYISAEEGCEYLDNKLGDEVEELNNSLRYNEDPNNDYSNISVSTSYYQNSLEVLDKKSKPLQLDTCVIGISADSKGAFLAKRITAGVSILGSKANADMRRVKGYYNMPPSIKSTDSSITNYIFKYPKGISYDEVNFEALLACSIPSVRNVYIGAGLQCIDILVEPLEPGKLMKGDVEVQNEEPIKIDTSDSNEVTKINGSFYTRSVGASYIGFGPTLMVYMNAKYPIDLCTKFIINGSISSGSYCKILSEHSVLWKHTSIDITRLTSVSTVDYYNVNNISFFIGVDFRSAKSFLYSIGMGYTIAKLNKAYVNGIGLGDDYNRDTYGAESFSPVGVTGSFDASSITKIDVDNGSLPESIRINKIKVTFSCGYEC